jgi:hypothetical protein
LLYGIIQYRAAGCNALNEKYLPFAFRIAGTGAHKPIDAARPFVIMFNGEDIRRKRLNERSVNHAKNKNKKIEKECFL